MVTADDIYDGNPNTPVSFATDPQLATLVEAVADELTTVEADAQTVRENLFIDTADADALETIGQAIDTPRRTDEPLDRYRTRVKAAYGAAISEGTIEQFASVATRVLDTDPSRILVRPPDTEAEPIVVAEVSNSVIDATAFTKDTIAELLSRVVPAGHRARVVTYGTFRLDGPDYTPPDGSGLGEGTLGGTIE